MIDRIMIKSGINSKKEKESNMAYTLKRYSESCYSYN